MLPLYGRTWLGRLEVKCTKREMPSCNKSPKVGPKLTEEDCDPGVRASRGSEQLGHEETFMHVRDGSAVPKM